MQTHFLSLIFLTLSLISARPQETDSTDNAATPIENTDTVNDSIETDIASDADLDAATQEEIAKDTELEEELEEMIEEDEDEDYYDDDYGWSDTIMNPMRNVGQSISNGIAGAADLANGAVNQVNEWWQDDGDYEYMEAYNDMDEQVNAWWDAHINTEYSYDEDELDDNDDERINGDDDEDFDDDDYEDEDLYDYYDLYSQMRYPKPEENTKLEAKSIHKNSDNRVQLQRMKSRVDIPYGADDYFDFVVIAMCVVLLFIMLLAGVSRYQNQRYLKRTYGKKNEENRPLIRD